MNQLNKIKEVLEQFEKEKINYCILRNYEFIFDDTFLPESLDTVIAEQDLSKAHEILIRLGFNKRKPQFSLKHHAYFTFVDLKPATFDIQIGGVYWNDMQYQDETILANRIKKDLFYAPSENDTFIMLAAHSLLGKRYFKPKYQQILNSLVLVVDEQYVLNELSRIFSVKRARQLFEAIKNNQYGRIKTYSFVFYFLLKKPARLLVLSALFLRWVKWKKFFNSYPLISIIGPDGAGKSTLVLVLVEYLQLYHRKVVQVYTGRGRGQLLPFRKMGNAYKHREKQRDVQQQPSLWKRKMVYTTVAPVFALDLWLRYIFKILPLRKSRTIVVTDRYCTDILLMENIPLWFKKLLFKSFPKPTLTFYLYNSAGVLHERRPQEPISELQRQMQLFELLGPYLQAGKVLTDEKEKVQKLVFRMVIEYMYTYWY